MTLILRLGFLVLTATAGDSFTPDVGRVYTIEGQPGKCAVYDANYNRTDMDCAQPAPTNTDPPPPNVDSTPPPTTYDGRLSGYGNCAAQNCPLTPGDCRFCLDLINGDSAATWNFGLATAIPPPAQPPPPDTPPPVVVPPVISSICPGPQNPNPPYNCE